MLRPRATRQFRRDWKRANKRRRDLAELEAIMHKLVREERLPFPKATCTPYTLSSNQLVVIRSVSANADR